MENAGGDTPLLTLRITSNLTSTFSERRFPGSMTVGVLKEKLELLTGANPKSMSLDLLDRTGIFQAKLSDDSATLADAGVKSEMKIHVTDTSQSEGVFDATDIPDSAKFVMTHEDYSQKEGTVKDFLLKNKLGKYSEEYLKKQKEEEEQAKEKASKMKIGDRCEVLVPKNPIARRGEIMFIGEVDFKPGVWIGVKYDEPLGKNDGSVKGKRYFTCLPNYGGIVSPHDVTVGDFPVELDEELKKMTEELEEL